MLRFRRMRTFKSSPRSTPTSTTISPWERHLVDRTTFKERRPAELAEWQMLAA